MRNVLFKLKMHLNAFVNPALLRPAVVAYRLLKRYRELMRRRDAPHLFAFTRHMIS